MFEVRRNADGRRVIVVFRPSDYPVALRMALGTRRVKLRRAIERARTASSVVLDLSSGESAFNPRMQSSRWRRIMYGPRVAAVYATVADLVATRVVASQLRVIPPASGIERADLDELRRYVERTPAVRRVRFGGREQAGVSGRAVDALNVGWWAERFAEPSRPVGVFVHIFYTDLAQSVRDELAVLDVPHQMYISTDTTIKAERLRETFPQAEVRVVPNAGRDVGAKFAAFSADHVKHDVVLHWHAKRPVGQLADGDGRAWHRHISQCLLGSQQTVRGIVAALQSAPTLGMVMPQPWAAVAGTSNWAGNRALADVVTYGWGWPELPGDRQLHFPVGSMFWARTDAIRPLLDAGLTSADFGDETGRRDGTLAHVVERLLGVACAQSGYDLAYAWPVSQRE